MMTSRPQQVRAESWEQHSRPSRDAHHRGKLTDDGIKYWLVPPKGEYDFELAILFEDDYPDFTVLTWALNRKQTEGLFDGTTDLSMIRIPHLDLGIDDMDADETVRELFEALLRRGINIGIDTSNLEN